MKWSYHLLSLMQFLQVLLLITGGLFCIALPFAPALRVKIANLFLVHDALFLYIGGVLLLVGVIATICFYLIGRHDMLQVSMNPPVSVDNAVLADLLKTYMQKRFPGQDFKTDALVNSQGLLELVSDAPSLESEVIEKHLKEMEEELGELLKRSLYYQKPFTLTLIR